MAAGLGFKTFTTGEVLTAADTNGYLMQGVLVFASSAARAAAITSPQEGQYSYLKDTNSTEYYDGAAWIAAPIGDITGVTAGTGISGGGTSGTVTITNSMATEIAAKGDLIVGTGAATFDNLTVGTNGQTLVADSSTATGLKWATPSSATTAKGVSVYDTVGSINSATGVWTAVTWNAENFDTDAFHSTATNTSRFTIPTGLAGKYSIKAQMMWNVNATGYRQIRLYKNGTAYKESTELVPNATIYVGGVISTDLDLAVGDYVELYAYQNIGTNLNIYTTILDSQFSMMYWGA